MVLSLWTKILFLHLQSPFLPNKCNKLEIKKNCSTSSCSPSIISCNLNRNKLRCLPQSFAFIQTCHAVLIAKRLFQKAISKNSMRHHCCGRLLLNGVCGSANCRRFGRQGDLYSISSAIAALTTATVQLRLNAWAKVTFFFYLITRAS